MYCTLGTTEKTQLLRLNLPAIFIQVVTRTFSYFSKNITIRGSSSTYRYIFISDPVSNERLLGGWVWFEVGEFISKILTQSYSVCSLVIRYYTLLNCTVFLNFNAASQRQKKFNKGLRVLFNLFLSEVPDLDSNQGSGTLLQEAGRRASNSLTPRPCFVGGLRRWTWAPHQVSVCGSGQTLPGSFCKAVPLFIGKVPYATKPCVSPRADLKVINS